jgi:hypothetical protein
MLDQEPCTSDTIWPEPEKLLQLRAKTDHQLLNLVHSKLELGLKFVALVQGGNSDHAEQLLRRADQAVIEVKRLLPVLSEDQRRGFGPTLSRLEEALDHLGGKTERPRANTASIG